jgi:hypothetical protein
LTARVDAASSQAIHDTDRVYFVRVNRNKMMVKSPPDVSLHRWRNDAKGQWATLLFRGLRKRSTLLRSAVRIAQHARRD